MIRPPNSAAPRSATSRALFLGAEFDLPAVEGPTRSYVIAATPRSGSTLLCDRLHRTGRLGVPTEYFHMTDMVEATAARLGLPQPVDMNAYLAEVLRRRTSANGVFGLKVHFHQAAARLQQRTFRQLLTGSRFIWLRRRDIVAQVISLALAWKTNRWHSWAGAEAAPDEAVPAGSEIDFGLLARAMGLIQGENTYWEVFFRTNGIKPLLIEYEAMVADPAAAVGAVLELMGETPEDAVPPEPPRLAPQANARNDLWRAALLGSLRLRRDSARG